MKRSGLLNSLDAILQDLRHRARGIRGSVLADANGLPLASDLPPDFDVGVLAAMGTLIAQSADSVFENLKFARPQVVVIEGKDATIAGMALPQGTASLLTILEPLANIGLMKLEMRRAAEEVGGVLGVETSGTVTRIAELFILYRNGTLIQHYSDALRSDFDRDILGAMLTAVQDFVRQTLASRQGTLDVMKYGGHSICFVRGVHTIAAMVVDGDPEAARYTVYDALQDFEETHAEALKDWDGTMQAFPGIDDCFQKVLRA